jgi:RNA polymerase sigma-70 factor (ECF subfamily)
MGGKNMDDNMIIDLYWERNESAISETDSKYGKYLTRIAVNILSDIEDSKESVNDTYLKAWNSMPPHKPCVLSAYLGKITRELSIDIFRRKHSVKRSSSQYALSLSELEECTVSPDDPMKQAELHILAEIIGKWLFTLSEEMRCVFVCRYYYMDSIHEISEYYSCSESKIKSMLHRARKSLREALEKVDFVV